MQGLLFWLSYIVVLNVVGALWRKYICISFTRNREMVSGQVLWVILFVCTCSVDQVCGSEQGYDRLFREIPILTAQ